ncbi:MAG: hypothetical protein HUU20_22160 [Pirellulales bacterium]|nr:hypothetical protein [Pirellulales bacterium]
MSLKDWARNAWLTEHETSRKEITDFLSVIDRDLQDCQTPGLSADWRLSIAYNAAVQVAVAGLAAEGYRTVRESHHHRAIHSLAFTLGLETTTITQLDAFRKKRNISDYERAGATSDKEVGEMTALAAKLREDLIRWLRERHSELAPEGASD